MTEKPQQPKSNLPQLSVSKVPEMEMEAFRKLMRNAFGIASGASDANPALTRFISKPYNPFVSAGMSVAPHNQGKMISPHNIIAVLAKFGISVQEFLDALALKDETAPLPVADDPSETPKNILPN